MAILLGSDIEARIAAVLQENIAAQLALIDAARAGETTPAITTYYLGPRPLVNYCPSIQIEVKSWSFREDRGISMDTTGRGHYDAKTEVAAHVQSVGADTNRMRDLAQRYIGAIQRVLLYDKDGLQTVADPTRFAQIVERDGVVTVVDELQSSGALVRSARLPLSIEMLEAY